MIDDKIRHYFPGTDPMALTFHQTFTRMENIAAIEGEKAGEENHRLKVEREARKLRLTNG